MLRFDRVLDIIAESLRLLAELFRIYNNDVCTSHLHRLHNSRCWAKLLLRGIDWNKQTGKNLFYFRYNTKNI